MKKVLLLMMAMLWVYAVFSQNLPLKSGLKTEKAITKISMGDDYQSTAQKPVTIPSENLKNEDVVSIVTLGSSSNAYGFGSSEQASGLSYNPEINTVAFIHNMGGEQDPGGNPNDLGYDISTDGGQNWTSMLPLYSNEEIPARFPQLAVFNPAGNQNPDEAYVTFLATTLGSYGSLNGYVFGRGKIGDVTDTTYHFISSDPGQGIYLSSNPAFTMDNDGTMWITSLNQNWGGGTMEWLQQIVVTKCVWNDAENDFELEDQYLISCPTEELPVDIKVEFSPDGNFGYIAVLGNIAELSGVDSESYYPIIWRTEDAGATWEGPIKVALAGEDGIFGVQYFLNNDELSELYDPVPPRDQIPFTTAFDFDLTVDDWGNPHIAVVVGVTGEDPFSIITGISQSSGYMYTGAFLLSSIDMGSPGSWQGGVMGRLVSFRGSFGDLTEDNRIQVARSVAGEQLFVSWLNTDSVVSDENNAPDIWTRGVDLMSQQKTENGNAEDLPFNVTFGSEATFAAYFFNGSGEVMDDNNWNYTIPLAYQNMIPTDPSQPVTFKYIQNFSISDYDFQLPAYITVGQEEFEPESKTPLSVTGPLPNPASGNITLEVNLKNPATAKLSLTNLMGQSVRQMDSRVLTPGSNTIQLNVSDLKSGIYFITVEAAGKTVTKKLVVK